MAPMPPVSLRIGVSYYQAYQTHIPDILDDVLDDIRFYPPKNRSFGRFFGIA